MFRSAVIALALCLATVPAQSASFTPLGDFAGGNFSSRAYAVSADGSVVVGEGTGASGLEPFRWTSAGGMVGLGSLAGGGFARTASAVSTDGSVVVGYGLRDSINYEAFRWTSAGGMVGLGDLAGGPNQSFAFGVSGDGGVVVGFGSVQGIPSTTLGLEAFLWTSGGGMAGLGDLAGGTFYSAATNISTDGTVVVGYGTSASGFEAFRWTSGGGMVGLGDLAGGAFNSSAAGVSADGSVLVGRGTSASGLEAFRWTSAGGMVGLGDLAGGAFDSSATGVSADGSVVIGYGTTLSGSEAFLWTSGGGMQRLFDVLVANGATGLTGWTLKEASGISADGQWIVGYGTNPLGNKEAFLAQLAPIPIPPAVWLFGSALGVMGAVLRKATALPTGGN